MKALCGQNNPGDSTSLLPYTNLTGSIAWTSMGDGSGGGVSSGSADPYIGSHISLTSKSEIRYEGRLYTVDTENSNIALQDVRSFGTEGRKKDGPQIPASDKIYDYIIFRGSDIKDLQVKSSPPIQSAPAHPHHNPAVMSLQAAPITSSFPPVAPGPLTDGGNPGPYSGILPAAYRSNMPSLYQPGAGLGSWALPPVPPGANGSLAMPMYWPGYYRPSPSGISHLQQQSPMAFQPPPTLPATYIAQAQSLPLQLSPAPASLPTGTPDPATSQMAPLRPNLPLLGPKDSLVTAVVSSDMVTSNTVLPALIPAVPNVSTLSNTTLTSTLEENISVTGGSTKLLQKIVNPAVSSPQSIGSFLVESTMHLSTPAVPSPLLAPAQLLQPGVLAASVESSVSTAQSSTSEQIFLEQSTLAAPLIPTPPLSQSETITSKPLLPLPPMPAPLHQRQTNQPNGSLGNMNYMRRGRGRGRGVGTSSPQKPFTEDFDFTAMNEKFNKDEVWGELGKGDYRDKVDGEEDVTEDGNDEEELSRTPIYTKDDFFDSLSCDALDRGGQTERTKFSEQRKIDTETFGSFPVRSRSGRGGRGGYRGGFRGSYYGGHGMGGRGSGYGGRARSISRNPAAI